MELLSALYVTVVSCTALNSVYIVLCVNSLCTPLCLATHRHILYDFTCSHTRTSMCMHVLCTVMVNLISPLGYLRAPYTPILAKAVGA